MQLRVAESNWVIVHWGVSYKKFLELRTPTKTTLINGAKHGKTGSTTAHNVLFKLMDESSNLEEYIK